MGMNCRLSSRETGYKWRVERLSRKEGRQLVAGQLLASYSII